MFSTHCWHTCEVAYSTGARFTVEDGVAGTVVPTAGMLYASMVFAFVACFVLFQHSFIAPFPTEVTSLFTAWTDKLC